jgi:aspartate/tyrosine/aromatic aminotransferase
MFSYSGLSKDVIIWLRENKSIYALESGRICVAAINDNNIDRIVSSIAEAIKAQK